HSLNSLLSLTTCASISRLFLLYATLYRCRLHSFPTRRSSDLWCAIFEGIQQEAELLTLLFFADAKQLEDRLLHGLRMDTDRSTAQLSAVQHQVVGLGQGCARVGNQLFRRAGRCGEGVMECTPVALLVLFEHREVHYPKRRPLAGIKVQISTQLAAQRAQGFGNDLVLIRTEEDQVTVLRTHALEDRRAYRHRQVLDDGRL